ncbi:hypothetical protein Golomagni_06073 [Golovinomyces magnicellulatus]|nr:hypothetical protein Golomagni_06073 [Golovinomyces magnicellulatus]
MADRKALNHYYPPDFDPSKIPRRKQPKEQQQTVRLMAPFSMRCNSCAEYIYKGRKFNARKELVVGQDYYGIKIFRFYIKCTRCSAEITFKTDPKNADYVAEHGASRNVVPMKDDRAEEGDELLTEEEKVKACELSVSGGADFVKTSTGFGPGGATAEDIALMRRTVGPKLGVKASGGIRNVETARAMIAAGATRIGASASVAIVSGGQGEGY